MKNIQFQRKCIGLQRPVDRWLPAKSGFDVGSRSEPYFINNKADPTIRSMEWCQTSLEVEMIHFHEVNVIVFAYPRVEEHHCTCQKYPVLIYDVRSNPWLFLNPDSDIGESINDVTRQWSMAMRFFFFWCQDPEHKRLPSNRCLSRHDGFLP